MESYKISIILPVYNVEKYLSPCLDSLVSQTLSQIEIVAVDDGSTDESPAILESYQKRYPEKLFVYTTENHGVSHARNYGFSKSRGAYVWFVDSDDYVEPDACERLYAKATADDNDLVLFSYYNVDASTARRTPFAIGNHSQNFQISKKPCELPLISPYPWIKLIRRSLFEGLAFPLGIRFEDLPIAYLLAVKARSIGVLPDCLYNYRKNVGFLVTLTPSTLDIQKGVEYMVKNMKELGFYDAYEKELEFITVRHFFFRFWKLLTNYEKGKKELKLSVVNQLWDYLDAHHPRWRENHYVRCFLPAHLYRMLYLYGSRQELVSFVQACDGMEPEEQQAWIKAYKARQEAFPYLTGPQLQDREASGREAFAQARQEGRPAPDRILLLSCQGAGPGSALLYLLKSIWKEQPSTPFTLSLTKEAEKQWAPVLRRLLPGIHLTFAQPDSRELGQALALCGRILADGPLPSYFYKEASQTLLVLCTESSVPFTQDNHRGADDDTGLWQHTLLAADLHLFPSASLREGYLRAAGIAGICRTPYLTLDGEPEKGGLQEPSKKDLFSALGLEEDCQLFLCSPRTLGMDPRSALQARRSFLAGLYQLDRELSPGQVVLLETSPADPVDCRDFSHIRPLPLGYSLYEALPFCRAFLTDHHPAAPALKAAGVPVLRFLPDGDKPGGQDAFGQEIPAFRHIPPLGEALLDLPPVSSFQGGASLARALETAGMSSGGQTLPSNEGKKRVLYYTGRKLGGQVAREFSQYAARDPEAEFWLAYDDFKSPEAKKALKSLPAGCHPLPLRPEGAREALWKRASLFTSRLGLGSHYPREPLLRAGREAFCRCVGEASFDQVIITSTDNLKVIAALMAAAPDVVYRFDSFKPEAYRDSRPYRNQLAFLCRLLQGACLWEAPPQLSAAVKKSERH